MHIEHQVYWIRKKKTVHLLYINEITKDIEQRNKIKSSKAKILKKKNRETDTLELYLIPQ